MKNVLITGASSGIGKATTLYFAENGWRVMATMICLEEGSALQNIPNVHCFELDVTSTQSISAAKEKILQEFGQVDVIINNAGVGYRSFVELAEDASIDNITAINWLGVVKVCREFIPLFRVQNSGQIINISSIAGLVNLPLGSFYHATKHAVESFSECMAYELIDFNISVCTVQFGNAPTNFQKNVTKSRTSNIASYDRLMENITQTLHKKTKKNKDFTPVITQKLFQIAENPPRNFTRYTIGFDAKALYFLRSKLGYRWFNTLVRRFISK